MKDLIKNRPATDDTMFKLNEVFGIPVARMMEIDNAINDVFVANLKKNGFHSSPDNVCDCLETIPTTTGEAIVVAFLVQSREQALDAGVNLQTKKKIIN